MKDIDKQRVLFIVIDDDEISNMISRLVIQNALPGVDVITFINPVAALESLENDFEFRQLHFSEVFVLLNIHMPLMTGWEFMARFDGLADEIKARLKVYMLSSSVDNRDEMMSRDNKNVKEFLSKPLTIETVRRIRYQDDL